MANPRPPYLVDRTNGVLTLSFNRPEEGNAIPQAAVPELAALFCSIAGDPDVRVLLVRGEGPNFSAGGNLREFALTLDLTVDERRANFAARLDALGELIEAYLAIEVPIVAACQGVVAGAGLTFALGADYVLGDETLAFLFLHQRVGLPPDGGVSLLLPKVVGERRARELILTAARVDAHEAYRIGLASRLVESRELLAAAQAQARRFARAPAGVLRQAKRLTADSGIQSATAQLLAERDAIVQAVGEPHFAEGVRAFLEKRQPNFSSAGASS